MTRSWSTRFLLGVAALLALSSGAARLAAAPPDPAAMRAVLAKVDLSKLPLPAEAKIGEQSAVTVRATTAAPVEPTLTFLRKELERAGWKEVRENGMPQQTAEYAQAMFAQAGCQLSVSLSFHDGETRIDLVNMGPLDTRKLPRVLGAKPLFESPFTTMLVTEASVADTVRAVHEALAKDGWRQFNTDRLQDPMAENQSLDFCFGPVEIGAFIGVAPAQGGKTTIQYSTRLLSMELPWPADARNLEFIDSMGRVWADSPSTFETVFQFYRDELKALGWQPDAGWMMVGKTGADMAFVRPDGTRLRLQLSQTDDGTQIKLDNLSEEGFRQLVASTQPEETPETEMPAEEAEPQVAGANVRSLPLPEGAEQVEYDAEATEIRFQVAAKPKAVAKFFEDKLTDAGWSADEGVNVSTSVLAVAQLKGPRGESASLTAVNPGIGGDTEVTIDVDGMSFDGDLTDTSPANAPEPDEMADSDEPPSDSEPAEPADGPLTAEMKDGLPLPSNYTSYQSEGSRFRRVATSATPTALPEVVAFYRDQLPQAGWEEQPGAKLSDEEARLTFRGKSGELEVTLKAGDETAIELATRNAAAAKEAGLLPKPGMAKVVFANPSDKALSGTFGGKPLKVGAGVGVEQPDGPSFDLKPGKYTLKIGPAAKPTFTETIEIGPGEAWGVMLDEQGALSLRMY